MRKYILVLLTIFTITLTGCKNDEPEEINFVVLKGVDTVEINTEWIDAGANLYIDDDLYNAKVSGFVNTSVLGLYEIEYSITYNELAYTDIRYVMVTDQTAPVLELNLGVDTIKVNSTWTDAGITVTDNSLEIITYTTIGTVDTAVVGTYTIIYSAIDSSGNESTITRVVTVIE
ncbi:DUF5011 domain-containing protein [Mycoplasmatota bacterium]|nr:DUF5011 domain-containing protein [Mycoplasmatota bacterium]